MMELLRLQMRTAQMMMEAQTVIGLRMLGMAGVMSAAPDENTRMVTEKQTAFAQSGLAAVGALMAGKTPAQAYGMALTPIGRATRANSRRLSRR
ncbi:antifreeze protein [uncultured Jannaschia sp.]|uniref:antifreeze protein n=1 Tax=uncultured Jannaschia sp. TaxID=293347 RepID=UPI002604E784|nr:antifreeze protein [uncultured Jannaschia sp.]